jgi:hypothetical protein
LFGSKTLYAFHLIAIFGLDTSELYYTAITPAVVQQVLMAFCNVLSNVFDELIST